MTNIADIIDLIHPSADANGVVLSDIISVLFDREIDTNSVTEGNFFLEGPDTDSFVGPDVGLNLPNVSDSGSNDQLESPNYKGIVPGVISFEKIQLTEVSAYSGFDTAGSGNIWRTKIIFTPKFRLSATTQYTVYISGDEDSTDGLSTGIRGRSIFDPVNGSNSGDGTLEFAGTYTGTANADTFVIQITTTGKAGTAEFKWWRGSDTSLVHGPILAERYEIVPLEDGVLVDFDDGTFQINDTFTVSVVKPELFTGNMYWSFTTGSGSIQAVPDTISTSIIGDVSTIVAPRILTVSSITPENKSTNLSLSTNKITIKFDSVIDAASVTADRINITAYPVNGNEEILATKEIDKDITVDGNTITLDI